MGIAAQDPAGRAAELHVDLARRSVRIDGAAEDAALRQVQIEGGDLVRQHIAGDLLLRRGQGDMTAVAALAAPAGGSGPQEQARCVQILNGRAVQFDDRHRVVDEEHVAVDVGQAAAVHGEGGQARVSVAGHGLIDHHRLIPV